MASSQIPTRCSAFSGLGSTPRSPFLRPSTSIAMPGVFLRSIARRCRGCRSRRALSVRSVASDREVEESVAEGGVPSTLNSPAYDASTIASSIKYHAEFTPSFSPENFELPKAYFATAESVRDTLIINWNATYDFYDKMNKKQAYYLSMEFLQGRALLNAIGNLELTGEYADALRHLGHNLENVAEQVR
ncbi:alpha-1,4 glucan phosphorylase L isozyme, chloroplastic/amyloplastic [Canna indica]|uniref:Alpha-1,4 glucan phosphorylase L isozyme, chloroplastic/amyloplastic n=1 Tax=Canna indica TaxID=4628 RepID=A0AAQ3K2T2_9LILI|nr:alpha-1,4 glucan phosphorylase L isozyme, chloroplastic/amyloplastic [Canna indica]